MRLWRARGVETSSAKQFTETHFLTNSQVNMFLVNCFGIRYRVSINISRRCRFLHELIVPHACTPIYLERAELYAEIIANETTLLVPHSKMSFHISLVLHLRQLALWTVSKANCTFTWLYLDDNNYPTKTYPSFELWFGIEFVAASLCTFPLCTSDIRHRTGDITVYIETSRKQCLRT